MPNHGSPDLTISKEFASDSRLSNIRLEMKFIFTWQVEQPLNFEIAIRDGARRHALTNRALLASRACRKSFVAPLLIYQLTTLWDERGLARYIIIHEAYSEALPRARRSEIRPSVCEQAGWTISR